MLELINIAISVFFYCSSLDSEPHTYIRCLLNLSDCATWPKKKKKQNRNNMSLLDYDSWYYLFSFFRALWRYLWAVSLEFKYITSSLQCLLSMKNELFQNQYIAPCYFYDCCCIIFYFVNSKLHLYLHKPIISKVFDSLRSIRERELIKRSLIFILLQFE